MMAKEVTERYMEALENLTNSKIEINTLTVMATEDEKYAQVIVDCIEARLRKVPANQTLPSADVPDRLNLQKPRQPLQGDVQPQPCLKLCLHLPASL